MARKFIDPSVIIKVIKEYEPMTTRRALQALAVGPFLIHRILETNRMILVMDNRREAEAVVEEEEVATDLVLTAEKR
jgi:hypothetical protein